MSPAVSSGAVALVCFALGYWGNSRARDLVSAHASPERRAREERSLRRGARSCYVMAGLFALLAVVSIVQEVSGAGTTP